MFKSLSTSLILQGLLAFVVGVLALAWPGVTVLALVVVFAVYALAASSMQALQAFRNRSAGPVARHLLLGIVDLGAAVIALAWPVPTALVLVLVVASWAVVTGALETAAATNLGKDTGTRAPLIFGGVATTIFGFVLFARPDMGAITLALLFGMFNLISGGWMLARGIELRRTTARLRSLVPSRGTKIAA